MNIQWNQVTWYSKAIAVILFIATFYAGFWLGKQKAEIDAPIIYSPSETPITTVKETAVVPAETKQCFTRSQKATSSEPYSVSEDITLTINGTKVTGTKSGTQAGPGMTNGYTGTLKGTKNGSNLTLVYAYTIEGSQNSESEEYTLVNGSLKKLRYPLVESQDVLVPDKSKNPTLVAYSKEACPN